MRKLVEKPFDIGKKRRGDGKKKAFSRFDFGELLMEELLTFEPVFYQAGRMLSYEDLEESRKFFVNGESGGVKAAAPGPSGLRVRYSDPQFRNDGFPWRKPGAAASACR